MKTEQEVLEMMRARARAGASLMELLEMIPEHQAAEGFSRGRTMSWFHRAFGLGPRDFVGLIFACEIFGDGASIGLEETEVRFGERMLELGMRDRTDGK